MAVINSGTDVRVNSGGVTLAGFTNASASNIKTQDTTIYTITSNALGSNANGAILLQKASGAVAELDSNHTFICTKAVIDGASPTDSPTDNVFLSLRGAKIIMTNDVGASQIAAPLVGDAQTQVIYRARGTTWNSAQPAVNVEGSTFVFQAGGDGHLGRHPEATVKNPTMIWESTSPSNFVLGGTQGWTADDKPAPMDGFSFQSVKGNNLVSMFTWVVNILPGGFPNNYFFVAKDWTYNVAAVGTKPTALLRSYRRTDNATVAASYWGAVTMCPTYLHIDLKTTLSDSGVLGSDPTYLRTVNYNAIGTTAGTKTVDVLSLRFKPTLVDPVGNKLADASVVVLNTNAACSSSNAIGEFRARLAASGVTDATGRMVITEPATKDYTSNTSHRTDSIVIQNRTRLAAWHKWWEAGTKLIPIADSRNGTGTTAPESYAASDYQVSYRRAGSQFLSGALDMSGPQIATVALSVDENYNAGATTTGISVSYASGVTTVALADGTHTLDGIWKAVIDFHADPDRNEAESVLPFTSWVAGVMRFGTALEITGTPDAIIVAGDQVFSIVTTTVSSLGTPGNPSITAVFTDANGVRATIKSADGLTLSTRVLIDGSFIDADMVVAEERVITVQPTSAVRVYAHAYGYQPKIINVVGGNAASYVITLLPESVVDTTLDTTIRDTIVSSFGSGFDAFSRLFLSVNQDLRDYTPAQVINALHYYVVSQGGLLAAAALAANSVAGFSFIRGGVAIRSPGFYAKVADSVTSTDALGVLVPLSIYVDPTVYTAMPTYTPVELNTSNVVLQYAPWTQQEADVPPWVAKQESVVAIGSPLQAGDYVTPPTVEAIQSGLATEANVNTRASQASVDAIPTTPLLAADYVTPPSVIDIQDGLATAAQVTALGTPLQASDIVQANIVQVTGATIVGTGVEDDPWGPV